MTIIFFALLPGVFVISKYRSGFVAVLGRPNVGKSTLLNRLIGQKVAITSPVAQTTRHRIKGVVSSPRGQVVFLDTPGFSKPLDSLGNYLTQEGLAAAADADCFILVTDVSQPPGKGDAWVAEQIKKTGKFVLLVLNKRDQVKAKSTAETLQHQQLLYQQLFKDYPTQACITISALTGKNTEQIAPILLAKLPEGPAYYPEDAVTDQRLREISAEIIREKVLHFTQDEIPHSVAVGIEQFVEEPGITRIKATLYVDQPSQKGMLIGQAGQMIKRIGTAARKDIETLVETKVFLELLVSVKHNWRKDHAFLKKLGLAPPA